MQIPPIETAFTSTSFPSGARQLLGFSVGQRFIAEVTAAFPEEQLLHLSVQGDRLRAHTTLSLAPGRVVELEVIRGGALPVLKLLPLTPADVVSAAMKQALPVHLNPKDFYESLLQALLPAGPTPPLPQHLLARLQALLKDLPSLSILIDPAGLDKAVAQSGLFLEAKLARLERGALKGDRKAGLLRFLNAEQGRRFPLGMGSSEQETAFRPALEALRSKAEGSIAKLLLDQLSSLPKDAGENVWRLDLPFIHEDVAHSVRLVIEHETGKGSEKKQGMWSVMLELNPEDLGVIRCKLVCSDEDVSIHFRCEQASTTELISNHLNILRQRFRQAGIIPGSMHASTGIQPLLALPLLSVNLVDEQV